MPTRITSFYLLFILTIGVSAVCLALPRAIAAFHILSIKNQLSSQSLSEAQFQKVKTGLQAALEWSDDPDYYFFWERSLSKRGVDSVGEAIRSSFIEERISLLKKGLSRAPARAYEWARLAHLYSLQDHAHLAHKALKMSVYTGPNIRQLHLSRLLTLSKIWLELNPLDRNFFYKEAELAFRYHRSKVIRFSKNNKNLRNIFKETWSADQSKLLSYYKLLL